MQRRLLLIVSILLVYNCLHFECGGVAGNKNAGNETVTGDGTDPGGEPGTDPEGTVITAAASNLAISNQSAAGVTVTWPAAQDGETSAGDINYSLYYSSADDIDSVADIQTNGIFYGEVNGNTEMTVTGLQASPAAPDFYFNVIAEDEDGNSIAYTPAATLPMAMESSGGADGFVNGGVIGSDFAYLPGCSGNPGNNDFPKISWNNPPLGTAAFVLIVDDPVGGNWVHLNLHGIPNNVSYIPFTAGGDLSHYGTLGDNGWGNAAWGGPCPPFGTGEHTYYFRLYALQNAHSASGLTRNDFQAGAAAADIIDWIEISGRMSP